MTYTWQQDKDGKIGGVLGSKNGGPAVPVGDDSKALAAFKEQVIPELAKVNDPTGAAPIINAGEADKWANTAAAAADEKGGFWNGLKKAGSAVIVEGLGGSIPLWKQALELMDKERDALDALEQAQKKRAAAIAKLRALTSAMDTATSSAGAST